MQSNATSRNRAPAMPPEERRRMIVRSALPLIAERGAAVTTARIARAAGIAEGTVFRVFADKAALLDACLVEALRTDHACAEIDAIPTDQPLAGRLAEAVEVLRAHTARIMAVTSALFAGGHGTQARDRSAEHCPGGPPDRDRALAELRAALCNVFESDSDRLRQPADVLAGTFLALVTDVGCRPDPDGPADSAALIDLFLNGALTTEAPR